MLALYSIAIRDMAFLKVSALCPPLIVTEDDIDQILARLGRALDLGWEWVQDEGLV